MQDYNWNDLKYLLALGRTGTLSEASRQIGVNETTVSRRIKDLAARMGVDLFVRGTSGRFEPTESALKILEIAERVEQENLRIQEVIGLAGSDLFGVVRITSVPMIINRLLVPYLGSFRETNPGITLELVVDSRNLDLSKREADLALRFARPTAGGLQIKAQKLCSLEFAPYGPAAKPAAKASDLPWIGYEDQQASLPQARWLTAAIQRSGMQSEPLRVSDIESALEAVAAGLGKSLLPRAIARQDPRLQELTEVTAEALPQRDIWLLSHADQGRRSVAITKEWLSTIPWPFSR